jgi:DNA-binding MarR family transcriptional regulator
VNPNHLFAATPSENQQDSVRKGRNRSGILYGECHGRSKLTAPQVLEIRQLYADGKFSTRQLAKRFGVAQTTIAKIVSRTGWKHI